MRYIVTGSSGFIGRRLCSALEARGDQVVKVDRVGDPPVDLLLTRTEGSRARRLERERGDDRLSEEKLALLVPMLASSQNWWALLLHDT